MLCKAGILKCVRPAINGWHIKKPAAYVFDDEYCERRLTVSVDLSTKLARKRESAPLRREERLKRRYPYGKALLSDLERLSFASESRRRIAELLINPNFGPSAMRAVQAVDGGKHRVTVSPTEQITTSISGCPREWKKCLLIDGQPVVFCDISYAHYCFLPRLLADRIKYLAKRHGPEADIVHHEAERTSLIQFLSNGDFYAKWCKNSENDEERKQKKLLVNMLLNSPNSKCEANRLYRWMRSCFPITFGLCEDTKAKDHRNISKPLQHYTAEAINGALLEAQALGIPAIPDVDAIICPQQYRDAVCRLIGKHVYIITGGVCCKVDGLRYTPVDSDCAAITESPQYESALAASGHERHSDVIATCGTRLTDCVPQVPISEAPIAACKDIKGHFANT